MDMYLPVQELNPKVLRSSYFNGYEISKKQMKLIPRVCYDYELEFYLKSEGGVIVNNEYVPFHANELNIKKPGQAICGVVPYECYIFCVGLDGRYQVPPDYVFGGPNSASPLFENELLDRLGDKVGLQKYPFICSLFHLLYTTSRTDDASSVFYSNRILCDIFCELFKLSSPGVNENKSVNPRIIRAVDYIKQFFSEDLNMTDIIDKTNYSKAYFNKCFKEYTGTTPTKLINKLRIDKAKTLLCMTSYTITAISETCGFSDYTYFSSVFKKFTGFTPSCYRQRHSYH